ncbi:MAG: polyphosphate polymerase domain-containing protein [Bacteroidales bacterium]
MEIPVSKKVENVIRAMDRITLEEMDHVRLMRRRDIKYIVPTQTVPGLLEKINDKYRVLEIDGERIHPYSTLYYDTPELSMYHAHHNRRMNRYKVRIRRYVTSNLSFFEVKYKNNRGETIKRRIRPGEKDDITGEKSVKFLGENSPYKVNELQPALENYFKRITLVHHTIPERITIDLELHYNHVDGLRNLQLPGFSVIEIKRDRDAIQSYMIDQLRKNHIQPVGFSKYCLGTAMMVPSVKNNLFMKRMRQIEKFDLSYWNSEKHTI